MTRDPIRVLRQPPRLEPIGDVLRDRHVREQRVVLEHDAGAAARRRQMVDRFAVEQHAAFALRDEAGDDAQQRRLAAAARPEQRDELAAGKVELDAVDRGDIAEAMRHVHRASVGGLSAQGTAS